MSAPAHPVRLDRLSALLEGLAPEVWVTAHGPSGAAVHQAAQAKPGLVVYLLTEGQADWQWDGGHRRVAAPSMLMCRTDLRHSLIGTDALALQRLVRVEAALPGPLGELLLQALAQPHTVSLVDAEPSLMLTAQLLSSELQQARCGQAALLQRAGHILFIGVLRQIVAHPQAQAGGVLSGLSDPRLARALVAVHTHPQSAWTLSRLAQEAGMSRTAFAQRFREVMHLTPGRYLQTVRLAMARSAIASGRSLKQAAQTVGYDSSSALSRALSRHGRLR